MAVSRGRAAQQRRFAAIADDLPKVLRGAGRAGGKVVADEVKLRTRSDDIREAVVTRTTAQATTINVRITIKPGWARSLAIWEEYGTVPHFITVDDSQRQGMTATRINRLKKDKGVLVIAGKPVGRTVHHPGAEPHPFLRPAIDTKRIKAIGAAQSYINGRVVAGRFVPPTDIKDDEV